MRLILLGVGAVLATARFPTKFCTFNRAVASTAPTPETTILGI